jgi:hypothetical protein
MPTPIKKNIGKIYEDYRIPPWLGVHMERVAAVAIAIFDARRAQGGAEMLTDTDRRELITACLLHDMANIIKFNLDRLPSPVRNERDHWETVRSDMIARYKRDEHKATLMILDELGVSLRARGIVDSIGFLNNENTVASSDILKKIAVYADSRVLPTGVGTLAERLQDMHDRYSDKHPKESEETERNSKALYEIERELFAGLPITPADITEASIEDTRKLLESFDIDCVVE